ncbi:MAG: DUF6020 family protein [Clostridium sp.]|nr:DUF6020 family protein [Acetatifactor muris]MCM1525934.1 DUF6020 family protein [Bacteroides sp.]MCM1562527.1 DUF6020 family protein [Clostridium sp.]
MSDGEMEKKTGDGRILRAGCALAAFLSVCNICYLIDLRGEESLAFSAWSLLLWVGLSALYLYAWKTWAAETDRAARARRLLFAGAFSLLMGILLVMGYQLQWQGYTDPGFKGKGMILLRGICVGAAILPLMDRLFVGMERMETTGGHADGENAAKTWKSPVVFLCSQALIWICWIPVWLAYWPVIMSYDFHMQSLEALWGPEFFTAHHPLVHTCLIWAFRNLGERLGSYEAGFACFAFLQQMIVSAVLGYACVMVWRISRRKWVTVVTALFWGLFPLVSVMVMCTTKDVLFGGFFLLFMLVFLDRQLFGRTLPKDILCVLTGILMMLFRNNAWYAMAVFGVLFVLCSRRGHRRQALILSLILIIGGKGALLGLQYGLDASSGNRIEKYSVLYQTMARVGRMQGAALSEETHDLLDWYVTEESWGSYNPVLADSIKTGVLYTNLYERESWNDMGEVLAVWARLGLQYPNEYMDAFLDLTRGYWFLDDISHAEMLGVGREERMGLLFTYNSAAEESLPGMQHISKFPWLEDKMETLLSDNAYYRLPVLSTLFKPAFWCLALAFFAVFALYRRDRAKLTVVLYPLSYLGTMFLGPTVNVRYVFPFILFVPVLAAVLFMPREGGERY